MVTRQQMANQSKLFGRVSGDGSEWGDPSVYGEKFRRNRAAALEWFIALHNTSTDEDLNALLEKKIPDDPEEVSDLSATRMHLIDMRQRSGVDTVRDIISDRLKMYNRRVAKGHFR
jgi:hypothetical protein